MAAVASATQRYPFPRIKTSNKTRWKILYKQSLHFCSSTADGSSTIFSYLIPTYPGINSGQACLK